jgi:hypothetical protein
MMGMIALNAYGKPVSELSETEKQTVSALATLAAGLAGGLTETAQRMRLQARRRVRRLLRIIYSAVVKMLRLHGYASTASIWETCSDNPEWGRMSESNE